LGLKQNVNRPEGLTSSEYSGLFFPFLLTVKSPISIRMLTLSFFFLSVLSTLTSQSLEYYKSGQDLEEKKPKQTEHKLRSVSRSF